MRKMTSVLSLLGILASFSAPKANAGIIMTVAGAGGTFFSDNDNVQSAGIAGLIAGAGFLGMAALVSDSRFETLIVLEADASVRAIEEKLARKFPFIDDAYVLESLALAIAQSEDVIVHNNEVFETLVSEEKVLDALAPIMLSGEETTLVVKTLSLPATKL
ncbi:MAG: hypothetical protein WD025_02715 [Bacteriovoracaceae bacterium]